MPWVTTTDAGRFLSQAGSFLVSDPVANNALLTEARFWVRLSAPAPGARFGWWTDEAGTGGAFVDIPDHVPLCSPLAPGSLADLPGVLANATSLAVEARDAAAVAEAWRACGRTLRPVARRMLLRLDDLRVPELSTGAARVADAADLPLLRTWFGLFQRRHPEDPSDVEFVVDHPLRDGGIIVWEVGGRPVAMSSRTPEVAGMTRMGLAFQPEEGTAWADAAFVSGCAEAARRFDHVLVLSGTPESTATYRSLGFTAVLEREVLAQN